MVLLATLVVALSGLAHGGTVAIPQARPAVDGNRAPYDLVFSPDGRFAYVTEMAEGSVAVLDTARMSVVECFSTGGERPAGLALSPNGRELLVANTYSGSVAVLGATNGVRRGLVSLPGMPYGVAVAADGKHAYITVSQLDQLAVLDLTTLQVTTRIPVGRRPRALALTSDGKTLAVGNLADGSVSVINTETLKEEARVRLKGINLRGVAVTADGTEAFVTLMPALNGKVTDDPREVWHDVVQSVRLSGDTSSPDEDQWTDFARVSGIVEVLGSPDQHDLVLDPKMEHAWIAVAGRDVVSRISIRDPRRNTIWPFFQRETPVGANPRGLAMTPDGKQVWVANHLGNSLSVLDAYTAQAVKTIDLGRSSRVDPTIRGQYLFNNAGSTRLHRFTCGSCHPDGAADGLTWSFAHVKDGFGKRNTRDLRAGIGSTAPSRWSGADEHLAGFVNSEVTGLLGGPELSAEDRQTLAEAVAAFRLPPNPHRDSNGKITEAARRGQALFEGKAGCSGCHSGPAHGGTGQKAWVGTTPDGLRVDVPHLSGVYDSAPYLHDGRAGTLEDVFEKHNSQGRHGEWPLLSPEDREALLRYVREL